MPKYQIINPVTLGKKNHKTGTISCDAKDAAPLVKSGSLVEVTEEKNSDDTKPSVKELKKLAKKSGVDGYTKMNQAELIAALKIANAK